MGIRLQAKHYSKKITFVSGAILMLVGGLFFVNQALADAAKPAAKAMEMPTTDRHNEILISFCWK